MKSIFVITAMLFLTIGAGIMAPAALPPRPTPAPAATGDKGGIIELQIEGMTTPLWTEVEWQGGNGQWHLVDGWRGTIEPERPLQWWVGAENLGEEAFRWQIYDAKGGALLATSETFDLPVANRQTVSVQVMVDP